MLPINAKNICLIIAKAREFHAKKAVVIPVPPLNPTDDWALQVLANHRDDFTYLGFVAAINDLKPDQQAALAALMWPGVEIMISVNGTCDKRCSGTCDLTYR